jgi:HAE1 family hydrophobic/amphiphilic exporter-1
VPSEEIRMTKTLLLILITATGSGGALDLTLKDAVRLALENNRDIQIEEKNVEVSEGEIKTQQGVFDPLFNIVSFYNDGDTPTLSTFVPTGTVSQKEFNAEANIEGLLPTGTFYNLIDFSTTWTDTNNPLEDLSPSWFNSVGFGLGQELLRNFGVGVNRTFIVTAQRTSEITEMELEKRISEVLLEVERRYWLVVAARKNLELERTALELAIDLKNRNQIQVDVGVLPPVAVTQAESEVAARDVSVIRAENDLQATQDNLKNVLAMDLSRPIAAVDEPTTEVYTFSEEDSLTQAYAERPEIEQVVLDIENKKTLKNYYSNQKLPRLAVEGSLQLQGLGGDENPDRLSFEDEPEPIPPQFDSPGDAFSQLWWGDFATWQVLGIFSFPLFNRTARGNYIKATAELDRSSIVLSRTKDDVALDVRSAIRQIENSLRAIEAAGVSIDLAEEVVRNEQERLNVGIGTTREVLEAQRDLIDAGTREITAVTSYNIALAELEFAKGTILEKNDVRIEEFGPGGGAPVVEQP